jgi:hypothetical protein
MRQNQNTKHSKNNCSGFFKNLSVKENSHSPLKMTKDTIKKSRMKPTKKKQIQYVNFGFILIKRKNYEEIIYE